MNIPDCIVPLLELRRNNGERGASAKGGAPSNISASGSCPGKLTGVMLATHPNCKAFTEQKRIFIYAITTSAEGEELTCDYNLRPMVSMTRKQKSVMGVIAGQRLAAARCLRRVKRVTKKISN